MTKQFKSGDRVVITGDSEKNVDHFIGRHNLPIGYETTIAYFDSEDSTYKLDAEADSSNPWVFPEDIRLAVEPEPEPDPDPQPAFTYVVAGLVVHSPDDARVAQIVMHFDREAPECELFANFGMHIGAESPDVLQVRCLVASQVFPRPAS